MLYSTYFHSTDVNGWVDTYGFDVDDAGNAYLTGMGDNYLYTTAGAYVESVPSFTSRGFIAKFDSSGDLVYSSYLGDNEHFTYGMSVTSDDYGNAYVFSRGGSDGGTGIGAINPTAGALHTEPEGGWTNMVQKFSGDGSNLLFGSYLHMDDDVWYYSSDMIAVKDCKLYVVGQTNSADFVVTTDAYKSTSSNGDLAIMVFEMSQPSEPNTLSPTDQTSCINGTPAMIVGTDMNTTVSLPQIITNSGTVKDQPQPVIRYTWELSTDSINWVTISAALEKDYLPDPPMLTTYFRRIAESGDRCTADTSNVHSLIVNSGLTAPTVDPGLPQGICPGGSVAIGGSPTASGVGNTYEWTPNIGLDNNALANPLASPPDDIIYDVKVTDANGCVRIEQTTVIYVRADAGPDVYYCQNGTGVKVGTIPPANTNGFSYSWQTLAGATTGISDPNIPQPFMSPSVTTDYVLTVSGASGCPHRDTVRVTPIAGPTADAGADQSVCLNESITLGGASSAGTYSWSTAHNWLNSLTVANPTLTAHNEPVSNPMEVVIQVRDNTSGCIALDTALITVDTIPGLDIPNYHCPSPAILGSAPMANTTYRWYTEGSTAPASTFLTDTTIAQPTATVSSETKFYLEVSNNSGCKTVDFTFVNPNCVSTICDLPVLPLNSVTACSAEDEINLYTISNNPDYSYTWETEAGTLDGILSDPDTNFILVRPSVQTNYVVYATNRLEPSLTCSDTITVFVSAPPAAVAGEDLYTCASQSVQIGTTALLDHTYQWASAEGLTTPQYADPTVNPSFTTAYHLKVSSDVTGCISRDTVIVTVREPAAYAGPDGAFCTGAAIELGGPSKADHTYDWSPGIGLNDSIISNPSITLFSSVNFYLLAIDTLTGCSARDTAVYTEIIVPVADAGTDVTLCFNSAGAMIGTTDSSAYGYSYNWVPTTGLSNPNIANPIASPATDIEYTLYVQIDDLQGCIASNSINVYLSTDPCPSVDAGSDVTICQGGSTSIGSAAVANHSYNWLPVEGLSDPTIAQPIASPSTTTTYTVMMTDDVSGVTEMDEVIVTVDAPTSLANAGDDQSICLGDSTTIGSAEIAGISYSWSPTTGLSASNIAQPKASPPTSQEYIVTITQISTGCVLEDTMNVTVNLLPGVDAGLDQTVCNSAPTIGSASVAGLRYSWSPVIGLSDTEIAQPTADPTVETDYILTVTNETTLCVAQDTVTVTPNSVADPGALSKDICIGESVQIGSPALGSYTYSWSPSTGLDFDNIAQPTASPTTTTVYTLTATNTANGCVRTASITVNVINPVADAGDDLVICQNSATQLGTAAQSGYGYAWSPSANLDDASSAQPYITTSNSTSLILTVTHLATGCIAKDTVGVMVVATAPPAADAGSDSTFCSGTGGVQIGTPAVAGLSYSWSPESELSNPDIAQPIANPSSATTYTLTVYDNSTGCASVDLVTITPYTQTANAGPDQTICQGGTVKLNTSYYSPTYYDISWSTEEGLSENGNYGLNNDPYASPDVTTEYIFTITNKSNGCSASDDVVVTVTNDIAPTAYAGSDRTICRYDTIEIGAEATSGYTYAWSPNWSSYITNSSTANPLAHPTSSRTFTVTVTDTGTGCTATDDAYIRVITYVPANAGTDAEICADATNSISLGTSAYLNKAYSWLPTDGLSDPTISNPTALPDVTTTYTLTVVDTTNGNNARCTNSATVTIVVNEGPTVSAGPDITINGGDGSFIGAAANKNISYAWSPATGLNNSTLSQPYTSPTVTTEYIVTATNNLTGCTSADTVTVTVNNCVNPSVEYVIVYDASQPPLSKVQTTEYFYQDETMGVVIDVQTSNEEHLCLENTLATGESPAPAYTILDTILYVLIGDTLYATSSNYKTYIEANGSNVLTNDIIPNTQEAFVYRSCWNQEYKTWQSSGSIRLSDYCTNGNWNYYFSPNDPDEYGFAIEMGSNTTAIEYIEIRVDDNCNDRYVKDANDATFVMIRDWHVKTLNDAALTAPVNVRFYFPPNEFKQMLDSAIVKANEWGVTPPTASDVKWFKMDQFDPSTDIESTGSTLLSNDITAQQSNATDVNGVNLVDNTPSIGNSKNYIQFNNITGFSGGTAMVHVMNAPLPVDIKDFSAKADGCNVLLNWVSETEAKFSHYELEYSTDGNTFKKVESVKASGGGYTEAYQYYDESAGKQNYYRLKLIDLDGRWEYTNVIEVETECNLEEEELSIYPNPLSDNMDMLTVKFFSREEDLKFSISDILGRPLRLLNLKVDHGWNTLRINISNLPSGTYFIMKESTKKGQKQSVKFIIQE